MFIAGILRALEFVAGIFKALGFIADILKALGCVAGNFEAVMFTAGILKTLEFVAGILKAHPLLQPLPAKATLELPPDFSPLLQCCFTKAFENRVVAPSSLLQASWPACLPQGRLLAYPRVVCPLTPGPPQKEEIEEFYRSITKDGKQPGESFYKYS